MTDYLDGTVTVVTGGGRGIGREIALHQAEAGALVAVLARTPREIEDTAGLIERKGGRALAVAVDLVDHRAVVEAFARIAGCRRPGQQSWIVSRFRSDLGMRSGGLVGRRHH